MISSKAILLFTLVLISLACTVKSGGTTIQDANGGTADQCLPGDHIDRQFPRPADRFAMVDSGDHFDFYYCTVTTLMLQSQCHQSKWCENYYGMESNSSEFYVFESFDDDFGGGPYVAQMCHPDTSNDCVDDTRRNLSQMEGESDEKTIGRLNEVKAEMKPHMEITTLRIKNHHDKEHKDIKLTDKNLKMREGKIAYQMKFFREADELIVEIENRRRLRFLASSEIAQK
jgi:hypothetical protein